MKRIFILLPLLVVAMMAMGQAKKPTLMVVPSDAWCNLNHYTTIFNNQGAQETLPDYAKALSSDVDLTNVVAKVGAMMADRGFPLKDLGASMKSINNLNAENSLLTGRSSGAKIAESPIDHLRRTAKADIVLEVQWDLVNTGPKTQVRYLLRGLDAYTNKQVAAAQGTGTPSFSASVPTLLEEAIVDRMDNFCAQLMDHFNDMEANGREVTIDLLVFDNGSGIDLVKEYDGEELIEIIDNWMNDHTVQHRYNRSDDTETMALFEQVRIPLYAPSGKAMDTRAFANDLAKFLRAAPYAIPCKVVNRGLGRCAIILGEK